MEVSKLVYVIPLVVVLYVSYVGLDDTKLGNVSIPTASGPTLSVIDVGAQDNEGNATLQGPFERVSEPLNRNNVTYRLIEKDLVYFGSKVKQNFSKVKVELRFIDTIPEGYELNIGMKNKKEWSYLWKPVYNPFYESLDGFNLTGEDSDFRIYSLNNNLTTPVSSFLSFPPEGSVIATDVQVELNNIPNINYGESSKSIGEFRGNHTFYIYTEGNLNLSVKKQDLNWYNGSDALEIKLYSPSNELVDNITIPDDGNTGDDNSRGPQQVGTLESVLEKGIYKVTMTSGGNDLLIRSIELNKGSIIVQNPSLAGAIYTGDTSFKLYTRAVKGDRLGFETYHAGGLQTVNITSGNYAKSLNITTVNEWHYIDLPPSNELYQIEVPKGDIIINANSYFSFSRDSYFSPSTIRILPLQNSMDWLGKNKVDYVIIPNQQVIKDGNWTIASTEFNLSDAYIENGALNFVINAPHLKDYNNSIPLDWIKIYMEK